MNFPLSFPVEKNSTNFKKNEVINKMFKYSFALYVILIIITAIYINELRYIFYLVIFILLIYMKNQYKEIKILYISFVGLAVISLLLSFPFKEVFVLEIFYAVLYISLYKQVRDTIKDFKVFLILIKGKLIYYIIMFLGIVSILSILPVLPSIKVISILLFSMILTLLYVIISFILLMNIDPKLTYSHTFSKSKILIYGIIYSFITGGWLIYVI